MELDRMFRNIEAIGDAFVGQPLRHQCQDFDLPPAQRFERNFVFGFYPAGKGKQEI